MKKYIFLKRLSVMAVAIVLLLTASSCSTGKKVPKLKLTDQSSAVVEKMPNRMSIVEIFSDISGLDLFLTLKTDGLDCKVEKDENASTADYLYYDKRGNLVFTDFEGYGEDSFEYYTESKCGLLMTVRYVDDDGKRVSVSASTGEYSVTFKNPDESEKYGAKEIEITSGYPLDDDDGNSVTYTVDGDNCYVSTAYYFDTKDGFHRYSCSLNDGKYDEYNDVIFERIDTVKDDSGILSLAATEGVTDTEILTGNHSIKYKMDLDYNKEWFVVADLFFIFDDSKNAEAFAHANGYELKNSPYADNLMTVTVPNVVIPVDESFEGFNEFLKTEFNDYSFESIKLTEDGKLCGFGIDAPLLMYS